MTTEEYEGIITRAEELVEHGNYRDAQALLEKALKREHWPTEELRAKSFLLLGLIALRRGDFTTALLHLRTAQKKSSSPSWVLLEAIRIEGIVFSEKGNFKGALERYNFALDISKQLGNKKAIAACLNNIALIHMHRGEFEKSLVTFDEGLAIAVEAEDKVVSSKILNNLAEIYAKRGQYDVAYEHYSRSLLIFKERGDKEGQAIVLGNISEIYKARGDYIKCIDYLQQAYDLAKEIGLKRSLVTVHSNLGELHWLEGDLRKATEVLEQGINLCNEISLKDAEYSRMLLLLTGVQTDRGKLNEAETLLEKATALNERMQSETLGAEICFVRGYLEAPIKGKGNLGNAKQAYNEALALAEKEKLGLADIWINASLGLAHIHLHEYSSSLDDKYLLHAEERLNAIFDRAKQESEVPILCQVLQLQGLLAIAQMRHDEALIKYDEARILAEKRGLTYLADKANENYEKAAQLRAKSRKILAKDPSTVRDVMQYVKDRVREVQRMVQTYGGG